jgi:hypothetical protein
LRRQLRHSLLYVFGLRQKQCKDIVRDELTAPGKFYRIPRTFDKSLPGKFVEYRLEAAHRRYSEFRFECVEINAGVQA